MTPSALRSLAFSLLVLGPQLALALALGPENEEDAPRVIEGYSRTAEETLALQEAQQKQYLDARNAQAKQLLSIRREGALQSANSGASPGSAAAPPPNAAALAAQTERVIPLREKALIGGVAVFLLLVGGFLFYLHVQTKKFRESQRAKAATAGKTPASGAAPTKSKRLFHG
mgnify:FL=1